MLVIRTLQRKQAEYFVFVLVCSCCTFENGIFVVAVAIYMCIFLYPGQLQSIQRSE